MKKIICVFLIVIILVFNLSGCNKAVADFTYKFDRAIISLPNGEVIDGKVQSWLDFEDGDQIQVKVDGVTYLVHCTNIVFIKE